ncbi:redoxin domain-containing protein [Corallococcus aberystwythensis]|uniref:TlpA family protein disulfide reductase n=1 Tax=Corallococcus aberystwythensis TaxID=2316722 RepID=A0A3A8QGJ9_9BACT|nr:redoxin domain-containing protein [Corallococcus aberystwythensis]RKH67088.1 TlpA family protein disulfide reductase [Corallococcus aberystwythensis]
MTLRPAPEWRTTGWLNTPEPLSLERLRGKVILLHAFQMLCPGCVARSIPQAQRVAELFAGAPLAVVGLHTVFEHHEAMKLESLRAFLHEYRVKFPVGVDAPGEGGDPIPRTMRAYAMQGTPTTVLIDAQGRLRRQVFGLHDDLLLGAELQTLLLEARTGPVSGVQPSTPGVHSAGGCDDGGCAVPTP